MTISILRRRLNAAAAVAALALGFAAAPVTIDLTGAALSLKSIEAFARQGRGADDPVGHIRHGRGRDDAPGDDKGGAAKSRGHDDAPGHDRGGDKNGGKGRGGHDDGPGHK